MSFLPRRSRPRPTPDALLDFFKMGSGLLPLHWKNSRSSERSYPEGNIDLACSEANSIERQHQMKQMLMIAAFLCEVGHLSQSAIGELRLTVTDPTCSRLKSTIELVSQGNDYRNTLATDDQGNLDAKRLPFGIYQIRSARRALLTRPSRLTYDLRSPWIARFG
jgi:hypothetical protein